MVALALAEVVHEDQAAAAGVVVVVALGSHELQDAVASGEGTQIPGPSIISTTTWHLAPLSDHAGAACATASKLAAAKKAEV